MIHPSKIKTIYSIYPTIVTALSGSSSSPIPVPILSSYSHSLNSFLCPSRAAFAIAFAVVGPGLLLPCVLLCAGVVAIRPRFLRLRRLRGLADVVRKVLQADPEAVIWNTRVSSRPDLVREAKRMYDEREEEIEAVFVISNEETTTRIVYGLESKGVPAFGPIFDS